MATYTSNYGWTKPSGSDNVDISVLNNNLDDQDSTIHDAFLNMAPPFSESSTYAVDDIVLYTTGLYKCHTAVVTPGSWTGSTNWQVYKLSEGGSGGGGTSNYNQLSNKPQINSVELSGNKTASQLGLMASGGVVANPTGQTTGTLTALEVDGTKYAVGGGGGGVMYYLENGKVAQESPAEYITTPLDAPMIPGRYLVKLRDGENEREEYITWNGTETYYFGGMDLTITANTAGLSYYSGAYRDIFCDIISTGQGDYVDLINKPSVNDIELSGNKTSAQLGMANSNTFQGTIAEWNQLTTAEKKAYDHASLTGTGGGEYNVDKTTGDLIPTAGMPSEYPATQVMLSDGVTSVEDALDNLNKPSGSGAANRLAFREEITEITDEMWASIANGTFDKVHVGMHYTAASGRKYWFADADYYFGKSSPEQTRHHMLVVEDEISHTAQHQTTNVTTGGATASLIYTTTLPGIQSELNADFGESHILTQSLYLTNAISNNVASGGAYSDKKAALLNICQVMGHGLGYTEGTGQYLNALLRERQLSLFQAMPETIVARDKTTQKRQWYWCDDVISGSAFGFVNVTGGALSIGASTSGGVRRAFLIG